MDKDPFKDKEQLPITAEIATMKDLGAIKRIRLEAVQDSPDSFDDDPEAVLEKTDKEWENIISGDNDFVILGKMGTNVIGMLSSTKNESLAYEKEGKSVTNVWYIRWGYLKPEFRKKSAGFAIKGLEEALNQVRRRGGEAAVLMIRKENKNKEAIVKIGQKFGFEIIEGKLRPGSVFMRLDLVK